LNAPVSAAASTSYVLPALRPLIGSQQPPDAGLVHERIQELGDLLRGGAHMIRVTAKTAMSERLLQESNDNFLLPPLDPNHWFCQPITHSSLRNGLEDPAHEEHNAFHEE